MTRTLKDIQQHTLVRIVDDNEDLRETCEMMLTYAGWQVRTAGRFALMLVHGLSLWMTHHLCLAALFLTSACRT